MIKAINIYTNDSIEVLPAPTHIKMMWHKNEYCKSISDEESLVLVRAEYNKKVITKDRVPGGYDYYEIQGKLYMAEEYHCSLKEKVKFKANQLSFF